MIHFFIKADFIRKCFPVLGIGLSVLSLSCVTPRSKITQKKEAASVGRQTGDPRTVDQVVMQSAQSPQSSENDSEKELDQDILGLEDEQAALDQSEPDDNEGEPDQEKPQRIQKPKDIPFEFNQKVAQWIQYFSQKDRERFQRFLDRGEVYREVIEDILEENKVPGDLYYLGLIESGYAIHAKSSASAVGPWQFMKSTGKHFGLKVDAYVDERRDPIRATEAAASYLRSLYREFGSWYLALSAYNAGPGRIRGIIKRAKTRDFWNLVERGRLPKETSDYVPKFLAARYIGEHPELFAFYINEEKTYPAVELVKVPAPVRLDTIERQSGLPQGALALVNPHLIQGYTWPHRSTDEIWVPTAQKKSVENMFSALASQKVAAVTVRSALRKSSSNSTPSLTSRVSKPHRTIVVKKGENLFQIAKRYGLSVAYLKRVNGLKNNKVVPGQKLNIQATTFQLKRHHPRGKKR